MINRSLFVGLTAGSLAVLSLVACTPHEADGPLAAAPVSVAEQDIIDFRLDMTTAAREATLLASRARAGDNLSELSVGWFVYGVLTELSAVDQTLNDHFGRDVLSYLKHRFRQNAEANVDAVDHLDGDVKRVASVRSAAHWALDSLCHIPNGRDPEAIQADQRDKLATALDSLAASLEVVAVTDFSASSIPALGRPTLDKAQ
jgi:hypothetical protein